MPKPRIMESFQSVLKLKLHTMQTSIMCLPRKMNLTQEKAVFIAGVVLFSLMSSFIFWGPSKNSKKKTRNTTGVNGLVNMGETCFLNTLLQALATSPLFCEWLTRHQQSELAQALLTVVNYVNGDGDTEVPLHPGAVVSALSTQGWSMGMGQQDSHELFFALMSSLEEQTSQPSRPQDILQELGQEEAAAAHLPRCRKPSLLDGDGDQQASIPAEETNTTAKHLPAGNAEGLSTGDPGESASKQIAAAIVHAVGEPRPNGVLPVQRRSFMSRVGHRPITATSPHQRTDFPFRGQQLSQLSCTICSRASVVQHQAFDCLSLPLPVRGVCSLDQLLASFTAPEQVHGVQCDHCSAAAGSQPVRTTFVKQLSIGRLPKCLCIHIQRTTWMSDGQAYKRQDFVDFPEELLMDKFTYCHKERIRRALLQQLQVATPSPPISEHQSTSAVHKPNYTEFNSVPMKLNSDPTDCDSMFEELNFVSTELNSFSPELKPNSTECNSVSTGLKLNSMKYNSAPGCSKADSTEHNSVLVELKSEGSEHVSEDHSSLRQQIPSMENKTISKELNNGFVKHSSDSKNNVHIVEKKTAYTEHSTQLKDRLQPRHRYKLQAVVVHFGEVSSGHFVTFRRGPPTSPPTDRWFWTSDEQCHRSSLAEVMLSRAYMLFYEKAA